MINAVTRIGQPHHARVSFTLFTMSASLTPHSFVINQAIEDRNAASE
jgi:hypothetical protein